VTPSRLGTRIYDDLLDFRRDPRGSRVFLARGQGVRHEDAAGTDTETFDRGAATLTALRLDLTDTAHDDLLDRLARGLKAQGG